MSDTDTTDKFKDIKEVVAEGKVDTSTRKRVSKRDFLDASGAVVDTMEEATGARYTLMSGTDGYPFERQFGDAGAPDTMFAVFGFHTKVGNVANTVLNDKDSPGTIEDAAQAIEDYLALVEKGQWREPGKGEGFARIDLDALAEAVVQSTEEAIQAGVFSASDPKVAALLDKALQRQKLDDNPQRRKDLRKIKDVRDAYDRITGKSGKTIADLLG